ncbi:hypothetical protein OQA88_2368 [Cercophora sp. LCS_1]
MKSESEGEDEDTLDDVPRLALSKPSKPGLVVPTAATQEHFRPGNPPPRKKSAHSSPAIESPSRRVKTELLTVNSPTLLAPPGTATSTEVAETCRCQNPCGCSMPEAEDHNNTWIPPSSQAVTMEEWEEADDLEERRREILAENQRREGYRLQKLRNKELLERIGSKWTSLAELYAEAEVTGVLKLPEEGPPCRECERPSILQRATEKNPNGNRGRAYYACIKCPLERKKRESFVVFADLRGVGVSFETYLPGPCHCGETARKGVTGRTALCGPGVPFWTCAEGRCRWVKWLGQQ